MRDKTVTKEFYIKMLGFLEFGNPNYDGYLMLQRNHIQIHFFEFKNLDPTENYGQVYIRTNEINMLYKLLTGKGVSIHPLANLEIKPWGPIEFSLLDPDKNLLTFGQSI